MLHSKVIAVLAVGLALSAQPARGQSVAPSPGADPVLQGLIDEALAHNRQLEAARQTVVAAETRPAQAGSRPGPTAGIFYQNDGVSPSLGREPMTMLGVSGGQDIPYPGKLAARRRVAESDAGIAALDLERAQLSLVASVKRSYYSLLLARRLADLAREQGEVWEEVQETARARHASAVGSQQEMLRAQVEATRGHALHAQHHAEARGRLAQLNGLLGRAADTPVESPAPLAVAPNERSADEWVAWSEAHSPELKAAALAVERDERGVSLARLESKPDFNIQGGLMYRGSLPPMWQVSGSIMLPSRARARSALAEAEARLAASRARLEDLRVQLRSVVEQRLALLAGIEQIEATYRDGLLPQGQIAVESAAAGYAAGQGLQVGVLDAVVTQLDDQTDYLRLLATHAADLARLEEVSLESPMALESLLMHGRSGMSGGSSPRPASGAPPTETTTMSSSRTEMR